MRSNPEDQRKVLNAVGDMGRASGLDAAAKLIAKLADHKGRVVGTNELKEAAAQLRGLAEELRSKARGDLEFYSIVLNQ